MNDKRQLLFLKRALSTEARILLTYIYFAMFFWSHWTQNIMNIEVYLTDNSFKNIDWVPLHHPFPPPHLQITTYFSLKRKDGA